MFRIRPAKAEDAGAVSALLTASWHRTYDSLMGSIQVQAMVETKLSAKVVSQEIENTELITLVAVDNSETVVGVSKLMRFSPTEIFLDRLHIVPDAFGSGLADRLLEASLEASQPATHISLEVLSGNERAIAYYKKHDFEVTDTLNACGNVFGVPTFKMTRAL